jgi:hypothetical protein
MRDVAFFAAFAMYAWAGIDTRLIYHWQGPVFTTIPRFLSEFLKYPGGPADYLQALIAQAYAWQSWGAIALTAALLLYHINLYYDRTPIMLSLLLGLALAILFVHLSRRWRSELALLGASVAMLVAAYCLAGMAIVFFAPAAAIAHIARRRRPPLWIVPLLLAVALPAAVEMFRLVNVPVSARYWFLDSDVRREAVYWGLYLFYAVSAAGTTGGRGCVAEPGWRGGCLVPAQQPGSPLDGDGLRIVPRKLARGHRRRAAPSGRRLQFTDALPGQPRPARDEPPGR